MWPVIVTSIVVNSYIYKRENGEKEKSTLQRHGTMMAGNEWVNLIEKGCGTIFRLVLQTRANPTSTVIAWKAAKRNGKKQTLCTCTKSASSKTFSTHQKSSPINRYHFILAFDLCAAYWRWAVAHLVRFAARYYTLDPQPFDVKSLCNGQHYTQILISLLGRSYDQPCTTSSTFFQFRNEFFFCKLPLVAGVVIDDVVSRRESLVHRVWNSYACSNI